jgi:DNA-binding transcriptional LysR family regulator
MRLLRAVRALSLRHPLLDIEVLTAPQDDVLDMLHRGRISACMAFAGGRINHEEQFQLVGSDALLAVISTQHPPSAAGRPVHRGTGEFAPDHRRQPRTGPGRCAARRGTVLLAHRQFANGAVHGRGGLGWGQLCRLGHCQHSLAAGRVRCVAFKNTGNGLVVPIHLVWMKDRPLGMAARSFLQLLTAKLSRPEYRWRCFPSAAAPAGHAEQAVEEVIEDEAVAGDDQHQREIEHEGLPQADIEPPGDQSGIR